MSCLLNLQGVVERESPVTTKLLSEGMKDLGSRPTTDIRPEAPKSALLHLPGRLCLEAEEQRRSRASFSQTLTQ